MNWYFCWLKFLEAEAGLERQQRQFVRTRNWHCIVVTAGWLKSDMPTTVGQTTIHVHEGIFTLTIVKAAIQRKLSKAAVMEKEDAGLEQQIPFLVILVMVQLNTWKWHLPVTVSYTTAKSHLSIFHLIDVTSTFGDVNVFRYFFVSIESIEYHYKHWAGLLFQGQGDISASVWDTAS